MRAACESNETHRAAKAASAAASFGLRSSATNLPHRGDRHFAAQFLERQHRQLEKLTFGQLSHVTTYIHRAQHNYPLETGTDLGSNGANFHRDTLQELRVDRHRRGLG